MKKITLKSLLKSARSSAQKELESILLNVLQTTLAEKEQDSKKLKKQAERESKKLAKKLSKKFSYSKEKLLSINDEIEVAAIKGPGKNESETRRQPISQKRPDLVSVSPSQGPSTKASSENKAEQSGLGIKEQSLIPGSPASPKRDLKPKIVNTSPAKTVIEEQTKPSPSGLTPD